MDDHIIILANKIRSLSLGTSAFIEGYDNKKQSAFIIIKDNIEDIIYSTDDISMFCKCGFITNGGVISSHLIIKVMCGKEKANYYPFHFNYYDDNSLRIIVDLMKQKRLNIILCSENDECIEFEYDNSIKKFFKQYIKRSIKFNREWSEEEYTRSLGYIIRYYEDLENVWNTLGDEIELIKK